jgi:hypothetical protein
MKTLTELDGILSNDKSYQRYKSTMRELAESGKDNSAEYQIVQNLANKRLTKLTK